MTLLLDRPQIIEKIMFTASMSPMNSYFADRRTKIRTIPRIDYDPQQALKLLADAGWNSRDEPGKAGEKWPAAADRDAVRQPKQET